MGNFWILVNEDRVAYIDETDQMMYIGQGSGTITLQLTAGQLVRIENAVSSELVGTVPTYGHLSWFTGYLLHATE